ncbi:MAG: cupin domain-containing protein [Phormidesmis sp.]
MSPNSASPNHESEESAALYALDALEVAELDNLRQSMADSEELANTVEDFTQTAAAMPYGLPQMPLPNTLKGRLFQRIAQTVIAEDSDLYQLLNLSIDELKRRSESLEWAPLAGSTADAHVATLTVDDAYQKLAFYVRANKGGLFPLHAHDSGETVLVLEGDFVADGVTYTVGDRIESAANSTHRPETNQGCLVFCISSSMDELLN